LRRRGIPMSKLAKDIKYFTDCGVKVTVKEVKQ